MTGMEWFGLYGFAVLFVGCMILAGSADEDISGRSENARTLFLIGVNWLALGLLAIFLAIVGIYLTTH